MTQSIKEIAGDKYVLWGANWSLYTAKVRPYLIKKGVYDVVDGFELGLSSGGEVFLRVNQVTDGDSLRIKSRARCSLVLTVETGISMRSAITVGVSPSK